MSVKRRWFTDGNGNRYLSKYYYCYYTAANGKRKQKCTKKITERAAIDWEYEFVGKLQSIKSDRAVVEEYRGSLRSDQSLMLGDAFDEFITKRAGKGSVQYINRLKSMWEDFRTFIENEHSTIQSINGITPTIAKEYIDLIKRQGRYVDCITYYRRRKVVVNPSTNKKLSSATIRDFIVFFRSFFEVLLEDDELAVNPFAKIKKPPKDNINRETFTPDQLKLIGREMKANEYFLYPIFLIAINTGMREGDCCTIKIEEIDFERRRIRKVLKKTRDSTGKEVFFPILDPLWQFIKSYDGSNNLYLLPDQAKMYLDNPSGLSKRIKRFLQREHLNIETNREIPGRQRSVSIRDFHSLRHTFCYIAAEAGVPFNFVQDVMGHMTRRMTELYMSHATFDDKFRHLSKIPNYLQP